jgi:hypothetical protein
MIREMSDRTLPRPSLAFSRSAISQLRAIG